MTIWITATATAVTIVITITARSSTVNTDKAAVTIAISITTSTDSVAASSNDFFNAYKNLCDIFLQLIETHSIVGSLSFDMANASDLVLLIVLDVAHFLMDFLDSAMHFIELLVAWTTVAVVATTAIAVTAPSIPAVGASS